MNKLYLFPSLLLLAVLGLVACDDGDRPYNPSANPAVEAKARELFEAMKAEDYERVVSVYYEKFFSKLSTQEWVDDMKRILVERGPLQRQLLRRSQADTRFSGKFYILEYETVHTGDKRLHHTITILLPVTGGEMQLVGHKMTPWEANES